MRYFDGKDPGVVRSGTPWPKANFQIVRGNTEILSGFLVLATRSEKAGTREMNELSLAIRSSKGLSVIAPGRGEHPPRRSGDRQTALHDDRRIPPRADARARDRRIGTVLHDTLGLQRVAPRHQRARLRSVHAQVWQSLRPSWARRCLTVAPVAAE
jgi:7,8-dihydropterin-6-yl-methyl-4-(beta-D-ribofuranosyl)aminobenzene 5'-phosphate synthase